MSPPKAILYDLMICYSTNQNVVTKMSSDVAALPFQAHANYGTWSIDLNYQ